MSDNGFQDAAAPSERGAEVVLPLRYDRPFVTLLPRDPHCVVAQWELPGAEGFGHAVLRLYDLTSASATAADGPFPDLDAGEFGRFTGNFVQFTVPGRHIMYIRVETPGRSLVARLGRRPADDDGDGFLPVATSNVVHLPPGQAAAPGDAHFAWVVGADPHFIFQARPDAGRFGMAAFGSSASSDFAAARRGPGPGREEDSF